MNPFQLLLLLASTTTAFVIPMNQQLGSKRSTTTARNVVGKDRFDMEELRKRIMKEESTNPYQELFRTDEWEKRPKPDMVNIILFKPDTAEEGVHTIEYPKGSGSNVILAFESMKECGAFAAMLKAQQFFDPTVCLSASSFVRTYDYDVMFIYLPVKLQLHLSKKCHSVNHPTHTHSCLSLTQPQECDLESLESYCTQLGVFVQVVPRGMEVLPPTANVEELGHNPKLKDEKSELNYLFEMNDSELEEVGLLIENDDSLVGAWD